MRRRERRRVRDRPVDRAVAVKVARDGQHGAAALGRREERGGERRPVREPAVVERVGAVVERGGAAGQLGEPIGLRRVRGHALDRGVLGTTAAPADEPDALAALDQQPRGARSDGARADDHVQRHRGLGDWYAQDRRGLVSLGARAWNSTGRCESRWTSAAVRTAQAPGFSDDRVEHPPRRRRRAAIRARATAAKTSRTARSVTPSGRPHQLIAPGVTRLNLRCLWCCSRLDRTAHARKMSAPGVATPGRAANFSNGPHEQSVLAARDAFRGRRERRGGVARRQHDQDQVGRGYGSFFHVPTPAARRRVSPRLGIRSPARQGPDGDPIDALVLSEGTTFSGLVLAARPIGVVRLEQNRKHGDGRERNNRGPSRSSRTGRVVEISSRSTTCHRASGKSWSSSSSTSRSSKTRTPSCSAGRARPRRGSWSRRSLTGARRATK